MRRLLIGGVSLLSLVVLMEPVYADEPPPRRERAAPRQVQPRQVAQPRQVVQARPNWSGGQLGGSNGTSSVNNTFVEPGAYVCPAAFTFGIACFENFLTFEDQKVVYTVGPFAGYRWQMGLFVAGVEADAAWKKAESSASLAVVDCFDPPSCFTTRSDTKAGSLKQGWDASVRGRFGALVTPFTLVYGTVGVAFSKIEGSFSYTGVIVESCCGPTSNARASGSWSDTRVGWTAGAGVEYEFFAGVKGRIEYRYADFGTYTKTVPVTTLCVAPTLCSAPSSSASIELHPSFHTLRVGIGFDL